MMCPLSPIHESSPQRPGQVLGRLGSGLPVQPAFGRKQPLLRQTGCGGLPTGATVGDLVPLALQAVHKGGRVVCAGIRMSDIPGFPYSLLWEERQLMSVANLTRQDGIGFLRLVPQIGIVTKMTSYSLNQALADLRAGRFDGAAVLVP
jgi:D-arabinose 1-dehydrogenase-like Zn-dependent alcohol dehydrogenase